VLSCVMPSHTHTCTHMHRLAPAPAKPPLLPRSYPWRLAAMSRPAGRPAVAAHDHLQRAVAACPSGPCCHGPIVGQPGPHPVTDLLPSHLPSRPPQGPTVHLPLPIRSHTSPASTPAPSPSFLRAPRPTTASIPAKPPTACHPVQMNLGGRCDGRHALGRSLAGPGLLGQRHTHPMRGSPSAVAHAHVLPSGGGSSARHPPYQLLSGASPSPLPPPCPLCSICTQKRRAPSSLAGCRAGPAPTLARCVAPKAQSLPGHARRRL
jgi:hypothetical protein